MKKIYLTLILALCVCALNAQTYSTWYSLDELVVSAPGSGNNYVEFLMKNGESKKVDATGTVTKGANNIAMGSVVDVSDDLWDQTANPSRKMRINDISTLDSISFRYLYVRNTDSNLLDGSLKRQVIDTLLVYWYSPANLKRGFMSPYKYSVPGGKWDIHTQVPTVYYKVDTILLTPDDSTEVIDAMGGYENAWATTYMRLAAPIGINSDSTAEHKLFGYCLQFRSGVVGADSGYMIYQRSPSTLPVGAKRPNYFGCITINEPSPGMWPEFNNSYNGSMFVDPESAQSIKYGWYGFIFGAAFSNKKIIQSNFHISSTRRNDMYLLANTVTHESCKGKANGTIGINAIGGTAPYQYSINNEPFGSSKFFNSLAPGKYEIRAKDALNNIRIMHVTVWSQTSTVAGVIKGEASIRPGRSSNYEAIEQPTGTTYKWNIEGGVINNGQSSKSINVLWDETIGTGFLQLIVTGSACSDTSVLTVNRMIPAGLSMPTLGINRIHYYPVPASHTLTFDGVISTTTINIFNLLGQLELTSYISTSNPNVNVSSLRTGTYIMYLKTSEGTQVGKLLID